MSTQTTNLKLIKPEMSDYANITDISNNFDIIDKAYDDLKSEHADIRAKITSDINAHNSSGTSHADIRRMFNNYLPLTGGNVTGNITVQNNQVLYATNTITDNNGSYYIEYSDGSIVCGGIFTDLNQGGESGTGNAIETYAKRVNYLKPITKTMIGMSAILVPSDDSNFWGNSSACAMLRKSDTTGFYVEIRSYYNTMLKNKSKCMWRAYFK